MFPKILFLISSLLIVLSTVSMIMTKNIMHSCVFLLGSLLGVAGLYVTLGADFVAVTQIMVYVGGVVILMLFAVMLTGGKDFISRAQNLLGLIPAMGNKTSFLIGIIAATVMGLSVFRIIYNIGNTFVATNKPFEESTIEKIGTLLITDHVLAFEISSVLLLGALVGAAIIARPRQNENAQ